MEWQERPQTVVVKYIKQVLESSQPPNIKRLSQGPISSAASNASMAYEDEGKKLKTQLSRLRLDSLSTVASVRFDNWYNTLYPNLPSLSSKMFKVPAWLWKIPDLALIEYLQCFVHMYYVVVG